MARTDGTEKLGGGGELRAKCHLHLSEKRVLTMGCLFFSPPKVREFGSRIIPF